MSDALAKARLIAGMLECLDVIGARIDAIRRDLPDGDPGHETVEQLEQHRNDVRRAIEALDKEER